MPFYDQLLAATARERDELLDLPLIRAGAAGQVTRAMYVAFLTEAYHHVKHTIPLLMSCGARLPERHEWLREAVAEYIEEEIGHQEWILNDIAACGADKEAVRHGRPGFAAEIMVAYAYDAIARGNPVAMFGMVLVLEGTSVAVASRAGEAIKNSLALGDDAFTYLASHGSLDVGHTEFFATLMNRLEDAADQTAVIHAARIFYKLYGDIFRELAMRFLPARRSEDA
ncbi:MAG: iron-containing redox enzyme family protein [Methylobacillus sp.]|nr:iron-containing redox enzyme family protein [Methylobacillus sp.]